MEGGDWGDASGHRGEGAKGEHKPEGQAVA